MNNLSFVFYLLSFFLGLSYAQTQGNMQTLSIPDGLSSPNVNSVYQDRFGYIWIMTEDGLNRYDGNKIKIYRNDPDNPNSLFGNTVFSATEDQDGYLWIGGIGIASGDSRLVDNDNIISILQIGKRVASISRDSGCGGCMQQRFIMVK